MVHKGQTWSGRTAGAGAVVALFLLTGCGASPTVAPGHGEPLDHVRLHALMTERIARLSDQLNALTFDQHRTESELDELRGQRSAGVAAAATRLRQSALRIGQASPPMTRTPASEKRFRSLAGQLAESAGDLARLAREERVSRYRPAIERINATCNACHESYRDR
ncbi:MAG: cytochrome c [Pseudomonadota bacterium]